MRNRKHIAVGLGAVFIVAGSSAAALAISHGRTGQLQLPDLASSAAQQTASLQTSWGERAQLWTGTSAEGKTCVALRVVDEVRATTPFNFNQGGAAGVSLTCTTAAPAAAERPLSVELDWLPASDGGFHVLLLGQAAPGSGIQQVVLRSTSGAAETLPLGPDGWFLTELPRSVAASQLSATDPSPMLTGLDSAGHETARQSLEDIIAATTPSQP